MPLTGLATSRLSLVGRSKWSMKLGYFFQQAIHPLHVRPGPDNRLGSVGSLDFFKFFLKGATLSKFPFSAFHYQFLLNWNWLS